MNSGASGASDAAENLSFHPPEHKTENSGDSGSSGASDAAENLSLHPSEYKAENSGASDCG